MFEKKGEGEERFLFRCPIVFHLKSNKLATTNQIKKKKKNYKGRNVFSLFLIKIGILFSQKMVSSHSVSQ